MPLDHASLDGPLSADNPFSPGAERRRRKAQGKIARHLPAERAAVVRACGSVVAVRLDAAGAPVVRDTPAGPQVEMSRVECGHRLCPRCAAKIAGRQARRLQDLWAARVADLSDEATDQLETLAVKGVAVRAPTPRAIATATARVVALEDALGRWKRRTVDGAPLARLEAGEQVKRLLRELTAARRHLRHVAHPEERARRHALRYERQVLAARAGARELAAAEAAAVVAWGVLARVVKLKPGVLRAAASSLVLSDWRAACRLAAPLPRRAVGDVIRCERALAAARAAAARRGLCRWQDARFLTLTVRGAPNATLADRLAVFDEGLKAMTSAPQWRDKVAGAVARLEVERSTPEKRKKAADAAEARGDVAEAARHRRHPTGAWWHVHAHLVAFCGFWSVSDLRALWADALGLPLEDVGVWLERPRSRRSVGLELSKYVTKPLGTAGLAPDDVRELVSALHRRRTLRTYGAMRCPLLDALDEGRAPAEMQGPTPLPHLAHDADTVARALDLAARLWERSHRCTGPP